MLNFPKNHKIDPFKIILIDYQFIDLEKKTRENNKKQHSV